MSKKNTIKRSDYNRVLITETLPYETPIIFSNEGLLERINTMDSAPSFHKTLLINLVTEPSSAIKCTQPYQYKVRKNSLEYRRLALLHPSSQWKIREFYQEHEKLILHYCSRSVATIRAPDSIATTFYSKGSWENIYQYKEGSVASAMLDGYAKHTPSFFAYKGHDRLYKFFSSTDYYHLEKQFSIQMTLDVSKCFDSIYTHSVSWATKEKEFTKNNLETRSFGDDFDRTIRHGNHNETNGIPIGPEVSRIFSEVIFQQIDRDVIHKLNDQKYGIDYAFRRYVDDVYIFARTPAIAQEVYAVYADALMSFNLHANASKATLLRRPFSTKKSLLIFAASNEANLFFEKFLEKEGADRLVPKLIFSPLRLTKSFINAVKFLCSSNEVGYDDVASFLTAAVTERVKRLVNIACKEEAGRLDASSYTSAIRVLAEVAFFLYSVAPSVSASYKLSTTIILFIRFSRKHLSSGQEDISHKLYELITSLFIDECHNQKSVKVAGFIHLEFLNILLAARELGEDYLIPEEIIRNLFIENNNLTYFTISSCLFYIRDEPRYEKTRKELIAKIKEKLSNLNHIFVDSEKAHIFLDAIGCPYIPKKIRQNWIRAMSQRLGLGTLSQDEVTALAEETKALHWQVNWADIDLLNSLEKKELKRAY